MRREPTGLTEVVGLVCGATRDEIQRLNSYQRDRLTRLLRSGFARSVERVGSEGWHFRCARDGRWVRYSTEGLGFADPADLR